MKLLVISSLAMLTGLLSCQHTTENTLTPDSPLLGSWRWIETSFITRGMDAPVESTPQDTGIEMIVEFADEQTALVWHNGQQVGTFIYSIRELPNGEGQLIDFDYAEADVLLLPEEGILHIQGNKLEIIGGYNDAGGNQLYEKL